MLIQIKKSTILCFKNYKFKCVIGKKGIKKNKIEGDKATPKGTYSLGKLYFRADRIKSIKTKLPLKIIKKNMGWCHLPNDKKYNKEIKIKNNNNTFEKLYRRDHKYDALIVINYNVSPTLFNKGSAIFIHLTRNYKPTAGCIALKLKDFLVLAKFCNKKTKIRIN